MTWSYSGNPASSDNDAVRFFIGDTDTNDQQLSDEEIAFAVTVGGDKYVAAVICAEALVAKYARLGDSQIESISASASQKHAHYLSLLETLKDKAEAYSATASLPGPEVSGVNTETMDSIRENEDRYNGVFIRDRFSNPPGW